MEKLTQACSAVANQQQTKHKNPDILSQFHSFQDKNFPDCNAEPLTWYSKTVLSLKLYHHNGKSSTQLTQTNFAVTAQRLQFATPPNFSSQCEVPGPWPGHTLSCAEKWKWANWVFWVKRLHYCNYIVVKTKKFHLPSWILYLNVGFPFIMW